MFVSVFLDKEKLQSQSRITLPSLLSIVSLHSQAVSRQEIRTEALMLKETEA